MGLCLLYAALAALIVWSAGYLIWRLIRTFRGGGGCRGDCGCCARRGGCDEK